MPKHEKRFSKRVVFVYVILRVLVIAIGAIQLWHRNYSNVFVCALTLVLFLIPEFVDKRLHIKLPDTLQVIILVFIFSAEILGEIQSYYTIIPHWDTMLHTINGFIMAGVGFSSIDILNQNERFHIQLSPLFVALVAFCFSMTIGVLWEFFEYSMDLFFHTDMQKDAIVKMISTVALNPEGKNVAMIIGDIKRTVIDGVVNGVPKQTVIPNGYLDIGLHDTIKDMMVNLIGASVFSIFGGLFIKNRGKGGFLNRFIPRMKTKQEIAEDEREELEEKKQKK